MKMKNSSDAPITIASLGIVGLEPGAEVEVDDVYALRRRCKAWANHEQQHLASIATNKSGGRLVPANDAERQRYEQLTVDDLPEIIAAHEQNVAAQNKAMHEVPRFAGYATPASASPSKAAK